MANKYKYLYWACGIAIRRDCFGELHLAPTFTTLACGSIEECEECFKSWANDGRHKFVSTWIERVNCKDGKPNSKVILKHKTYVDTFGAIEPSEYETNKKWEYYKLIKED